MLKKFTKRLLISLNRNIIPLFEVSSAPKTLAPPNSPIFLIGPPRSGSTLLMQVLTDHFDFGYLSNQHCRWFGAPALADRVLTPLSNKQPSNYQSKHGQTQSPTDPAECGAWWYRFFRRDPAYVTLDDVSDRKMRAFRRSLGALHEAMGRPLIFKNLYASLRIEPIADQFPNALFIIVERDVVDNAQSILKGRMDALGSYDPWWSVPPPNVEKLERLPPVQQAVEQVYSVHALIKQDTKRLGLENQTLTVSYEEFCNDVHGTLAQLEDFARMNGLYLERRFEVPAQFEINKSRKIPEAMYKELVDYLDQRKLQKNPETSTIHNEH